MLRSLTRRGITLVSVAVIGLGLAAAAAAPPAAAAVNSAHPYSDPLYFPVHAAFVAGCFGTSTANNLGKNPCNADHVGYFAMNIGIPYKVPGDRLNPVPHPPVYAAGAGTVLKVSTGAAACNTSGAVLGGNQVWIYHGAGMVSIYEHLRTVSVKVGTYVTARTAIGTVGATGSRCQSNGQPVTSYLDFEVRRELGGEQQHTTNVVNTLYGCVGTTTRGESWPGTLPRSAYARESGAPMPATLPTTWVKVPYDTVVTVPSSSADWNCLRVNGTGSPNEPAAPREVRSGSAGTLSWPAVSGATDYDIQFQVESGSTWTFPCYPNNSPSCTYGFYTIAPSSSPHLTMSGLRSTTHYRVRLSARNPAGWSLPSAWKTL